MTAQASARDPSNHPNRPREKKFDRRRSWPERGGPFARNRPRRICLRTKFACTEAKSRRPDYEDIGDASERENDVPTMEELELCLRALKAGRACGFGSNSSRRGILYRGSESAKNDLFEFIKQSWREERLPTTLGRGTFTTIFKKGRKDDYGDYRLINLLNRSSQFSSTSEATQRDHRLLLRIARRLSEGKIVPG